MVDNGQKMRFVEDSYTDQEKRDDALGMFALFSPYEEAWNSDFVLQPIEQLQPAFDEIAKTIQASRAKVLLALLKRYRKWCLSHNAVKAVCAGVLQLKLSPDEKLSSSMVPSPTYLKLVLDAVFDAPEKETVDCVYRGFLWLAFAGIPKEQACQVTINEVDFPNMQIHHAGKDYKIPAEGLRELQKLCWLDTFLFVHKNPDYESRRPRTAGTELLRGFSDVNSDYIVNFVSMCFANTKWSLTYDYVQSSGLFYEKYELERFGLGVSFDPEIEQRLKEMPDLSNTGKSNNRSMMRKRYLEKYEQWKTVFNLQTED